MRLRGRHVVVLVVLLLAVAGVVAGLVLQEGDAAVGAQRQVGLIRIEGAIAGGSSGEDLFGAVVGADDVVAMLRQARNDPSVRAVVLRLNTPGGSAAASQEIGAEIRRVREAGKPVVVSMGDVAASGGYWIAANADRIVASPATITGSIGVIWQVATYAELYRKLGIQVETVKSGAFKDMGNPARPLSDEERALIQALVDDVYDQFVDVVAEGRRLPRPRVLELADGRVFTGRQALKLGLVDELGTLHDAIDRAAELAGIADGFGVRDLGERNLLEELLNQLIGLRMGLMPAGVPFDAGAGWMRWVLHPEAGR